MSVIKVPGELRSELYHGDSDSIRIESDEEEDEWELLTAEEARHLNTFLIDHASHTKSWNIGFGQRMGWNKSGVFLHESHHKRYFGVLRGRASIMLQKACPEALPEFQMPSQQLQRGSDSTENLLSKLVDRMPNISDEMRDQVFLATFRAADINKNNYLSRPELGSMMRKVVGTISSRETEEMMEAADANRNNKISLEEFIRWMSTSAPEKIVKKIKRSLKTEADIVRASFRAWDRNGDGMISMKEVHYVLSKHCPDLKEQQVNTLMKTIDTDRDGKIDYDEFIDFLFHRK